MYNYTTPIQQKIVFRQWSRKSYAMFVSIGREVVIGRTSASISDKSLTKGYLLQKSVIANGSHSNFDTDECDEMWSENTMVQTIVAEAIDTLLPLQDAAAYAKKKETKTSIQNN